MQFGVLEEVAMDFPTVGPTKFAGEERVGKDKSFRLTGSSPKRFIKQYRACDSLVVI